MIKMKPEIFGLMFKNKLVHYLQVMSWKIIDGPPVFAPCQKEQR